ncbi:MAG: hypothetical protein Q8S13_05115, partial [Dehalococcoidia bacterium]|nr:hypothetical protein [Dehalococcoidia bacterium]
MAHAVLYFPDLEPDLGWLRQTLLLVDRVDRIVPPDTRQRHLASDAFLRLRDAVPGAIGDHRPSQEQLAPSPVERNRLAKAFDLIAKKQSVPGPPKRLTAIVTEDGTPRFEGRTFLAASKLVDDVTALLAERRLLERNLSRDLTGDDVVSVPQAAADLILATIADRVATARGLDTVTDRPIAFAAKALDGLQVDVSGTAEGQLLCGLAKWEVPARIDAMPLNEYVELRRRHEALRPLFRRLIHELSGCYKLNAASDVRERRERLQELLGDFAVAGYRYRSSEAARRYSRWVPFGIATLFAALGIPAHGHELVGVPLEKVVGLAGSGLSLKVKEVLDSARLRKAGPDDHVHRMLHSLERDVLRKTRPAA